MTWAEALALLSKNLGNYVGISGVDYDTEGVIHSTRMGLIELKDGRGGFNPSIEVDDILAFTLDGEHYSVGGN